MTSIFFSRPPRIYYFKHGVIEFFVKSKQIFYNLKIWNKEGTHQSLIKTGKYNGEDPKSLIPLLQKSEGEL